MSAIRILFTRILAGYWLPAWTVLGLLFYAQQSQATLCTTTASGPWHSPAVWLSGVIPQAGDTAVVQPGDSVWLDSSTAPLALLTVNGSLYFGSDTIFLDSTSSADTVISVTGILDAGNGWFADSSLAHPIIQCAAGSVFRTSTSFPSASSGIFDSSRSPYFVLDSGSSFEYYATNLHPTDISYLLHTVSGQAYQNLLLNNVSASYRSNPLTVLGTLHVEFGASLLADYAKQTITISGDVINDNEGESGAAGAGLHGCGILSLGRDTWVFRARDTGTAKDTCHWSGPSQLGNVIVAPNMVLTVRFASDTACDSLDVLGSFIEQGGPCGGHLIGRVYSEFPKTMDSVDPIDTFAGIIIHSGTDPYLGRTKIVRTTGYLPPGANPVNVPVLRYYAISPGDGPQLGIPDTISVQVHCDEFNGAGAAQLHFWRSRNRGANWAFSGITKYDPSQNLFTWDTTMLGWPNDSGTFYWMLSEGYTDVPLPVELENFTAEQCGDSVLLHWQTASEVNLAGFEIDRTYFENSVTTDSETIASFWNDDSLRAQSETGASYHYTDLALPAGTPRYNLFAVSQDGIREFLASRIPTQSASDTALRITQVSYSAGKLIITVHDADDITLKVMDDLGRCVLAKNVSSGPWQVIIPVQLLPGTYFIEAVGDQDKAIAKFVVLE